MIYTIEMFRKFTFGNVTETIYATIDKEDVIEYFERQCKFSNDEERFVRYSIYEWENPSTKVLLDTWNNAYKIENE